MSGTLPTSGALEGASHSFPVRVYYEDTDAGGIVYHAAYLHFAERARSEMLRLLGWPHQRMLGETGCGWAVSRLSADYRRPARLDDALVVTTRLIAIGGASLEIAQTVQRDAQDLVRMLLRLALVTTSGRAARLPSALRNAFLPFLVTHESSHS